MDCVAKLAVEGESGDQVDVSKAQRERMRANSWCYVYVIQAVLWRKGRGRCQLHRYFLLAHLMEMHEALLTAG